MTTQLPRFLAATFFFAATALGQSPYGDEIPLRVLEDPSVRANLGLDANQGPDFGSAWLNAGSNRRLSFAAAKRQAAAQVRMQLCMIAKQLEVFRQAGMAGRANHKLEFPLADRKPNAPENLADCLTLPLTSPKSGRSKTRALGATLRTALGMVEDRVKANATLANNADIRFYRETVAGLTDELGAGDVAGAYELTLAYREWLLDGALGKGGGNVQVPAVAKRAFRPLEIPSICRADETQFNQAHKALVKAAYKARFEDKDIVQSELLVTKAELLRKMREISAASGGGDAELQTLQTKRDQYRNLGMAGEADVLERQITALQQRGGSTWESVVAHFAGHRQRWNPQGAGQQHQFQYQYAVSVFFADLSGQDPAEVADDLHAFVKAMVDLDGSGDRSKLGHQEIGALPASSKAALMALARRAVDARKKILAGDTTGAQQILDAERGRILAAKPAASSTKGREDIASQSAADRPIAVPSWIDQPERAAAEIAKLEALAHQAGLLHELVEEARVRAKLAFCQRILSVRQRAQGLRESIHAIEESARQSGRDLDRGLRNQVEAQRRELATLERPTYASVWQPTSHGELGIFRMPLDARSEAFLRQWAASAVHVLTQTACRPVVAQAREVVADAERAAAELAAGQQQAAQEILDQRWQWILAAGDAPFEPSTEVVVLPDAWRDSEHIKLLWYWHREQEDPVEAARLVAKIAYLNAFHEAQPRRQMHEQRLHDLREQIAAATRRGEEANRQRLEKALADATRQAPLPQQERRSWLHQALSRNRDLSVLFMDPESPEFARDVEHARSTFNRDVPDKDAPSVLALNADLRNLVAQVRAGEMAAANELVSARRRWILDAGDTRASAMARAPKPQLQQTFTVPRSYYARTDPNSDPQPMLDVRKQISALGAKARAQKGGKARHGYLPFAERFHTAHLSTQYNVLLNLQNQLSTQQRELDAARIRIAELQQRRARLAAVGEEFSDAERQELRQLQQRAEQEPRVTRAQLRQLARQFGFLFADLDTSCLAEIDKYEAWLRDGLLNEREKSDETEEIVRRELARTKELRRAFLAGEYAAVARELERGWSWVWGGKPPTSAKSGLSDW